MAVEVEAMVSYQTTSIGYWLICESALIRVSLSLTAWETRSRSKGSR